MSKVAIITDSSSGISDGEFPDVYVLPLIVTETTNGKITTYKDGIDFDDNKLTEMLKRGSDIKTSQANVSEMMNLTEKLSKEYDEIFVVPIATTLSSNYNSWNMIVPDYPKLKIFKQFMVGLLLKWTIIDLVEKNKKDGLTAEYVQHYLDDVNKMRSGILLVSDMAQLKKGGRVRGLKSLLIKILKLTIIITLDYDGLSFANIGKKPDEIVKKMHENFDKKIGLKSHQIKRALIFKNKDTDLDENMSEIIKIFKQQYPNVKFEVSELPPVIVAHTGYRYAAIGFDLEK